MRVCVAGNEATTLPESKVSNSGVRALMALVGSGSATELVTLRESVSVRAAGAEPSVLVILILAPAPNASLTDPSLQFSNLTWNGLGQVAKGYVRLPVAVVATIGTTNVCSRFEGPAVQEVSSRITENLGLTKLASKHGKRQAIR